MKETGTLIIVKRRLTEPKTALAGVMLETSFARFMVSMAVFSEEIAPSRGLGCLELVSMVETGGRHEKTVRHLMRMTSGQLL